jgi:hypothetical protein
MKPLFTFLFILGTILGNPDYCKPNVAELKFLQPEGFEITNTWAENGVLTMFEKATGNGMDILIDKKNVDQSVEAFGLDEKILSIRREWSNSIINEEKLAEGGHVFRIRNASKIQPVDTIIIMPGDRFIIEAYLMKTGDLSTHFAFEDNALEILSSIEQGGTDEKRAEDCFRGLFLSF